ncbi:hypothetical protein GGU11DRAFT_801977 [Lentinula aff. detonsa]|nr:hypothetical protein GGU11DRAFT_801977 [Lentinula aff. detonsa]
MRGKVKDTAQELVPSMYGIYQIPVENNARKNFVANLLNKMNYIFPRTNVCIMFCYDWFSPWTYSRCSIQLLYVQTSLIDTLPLSPSCTNTSFLVTNLLVVASTTHSHLQAVPINRRKSHERCWVLWLLRFLRCSRNGALINARTKILCRPTSVTSTSFT